MCAGKTRTAQAKQVWFKPDIFGSIVNDNMKTGRKHNLMPGHYGLEDVKHSLTELEFDWKEIRPLFIILICN